MGVRFRRATVDGVHAGLKPSNHRVTPGARKEEEKSSQSFMMKKSRGRRKCLTFRRSGGIIDKVDQVYQVYPPFPIPASAESKCLWI